MCVYLKPAAHGPPFGFLCIAKSVLSMVIALGLGNESIDVQGEKFFTAVAEHLLGGFIDQQDLSFCIDLQDRFRGDFQELTKSRFASGLRLIWLLHATVPA